MGASGVDMDFFAASCALAIAADRPSAIPKNPAAAMLNALLRFIVFLLARDMD